ncbi:MAG: hypothetical protein EXS09_05980 [Gemmataceae bacterium]|nr:hypothetical protein [Gemmataceae bacterium]
MCCFSKEAHVSATSIFARPSKAGQYIVYSMKLKAAEDLAMILPIPTPKASKEDAVTFINLEKYPTFFVKMDSGFPVPPPSRGAKSEEDAPPKKDVPKLKVVEVGSFVASFVPTVKDFARVDEQFRLPEGVWDKLPQYKDFGFAVFKLKKGEQEVHPMAFEFPRADKSKLFLPTVHIHDGRVHANAFFDHALYCQGADTGMRWEETPQPAEMFMSLKEGKDIVDPKGHVYRSRMVGNFKNADVWVG